MAFFRDECVVCCEFYTESVRAPCGHSLCQTCWTRWSQEKQGAVTCVLCRRDINADELEFRSIDALINTVVARLHGTHNLDDFTLCMLLLIKEILWPNMV